LIEPLSPLEIQSAQILVGVTTVIFVSSRFIPVRYRHTVGVWMTACYLVGVAAFMVYVFALRG
jgi:hypothetical protein